MSRTILRTVAALFGGAVRRRQEAARAERHRVALQSAERESGLATLAAGIAHDINNMLGVLRTGLDLAELRGKFVPKDVERMENAFGAAKALVDELYGFAGLEAAEPVAVDLARLLARGRGLLGDRRPPNVELIFDVPDDTPPVRGHVTQIGQAIGNLVLNAVEAVGSAGGTVRIDARPEVRHGQCGVTVIIDDDGPGVPEELRARLFKPLVSSKGARRGIGLASSASIARAHGGTLSLGDRDGPGTRFELWLPAMDAGVCEPADPEPQST